MKLLLQIMKANKKLFFNSDENINSFFLMAKFAVQSHVDFFCSDIIHNDFLEELHNNDNYDIQIRKYINLYIYSKHVYNILSRFVYKIKVKKTKKYQMTTDLYFNDLSLFPERQLINLLENNTIYTFRLTDLINIFNDSLLEIEGLFPVPKNPKNPYTNLHFSPNNLYNIYFNILKSNFHIPIIIANFFNCQFKINLLLDNHYPYLKDKCILKFCKEGSSYEKYENIENMFFDYRTDIEWVYIPSIRSIRVSEMMNYCKKLNIALKYYLLGKFSPNNWTKDKYYNLGKTVVKTFIRNNDNLVFKPRSVQNNSTLRNRITRRRTTLNRLNSVPPPPPPPTTPPPTRIAPPAPPPLTVINNNTLNNIRNSQIVSNYNTNREAIARLIEDIDLSIINTNAATPFSPSFQLPRTPNRI